MTVVDGTPRVEGREGADRGGDSRRYRPDIDGIRALAVTAVVLFHLQFGAFAGGYVGVDVFFVLSGFLITGIIRPKVVAGTFSFGDFYLRRIRRLVPALIATVAASTVGAAFVLQPEDMIAFARSGVAALGSFSNFVFFAESGYWDTTSAFKPLLHTWSLGVEEQFYLFWPAAMVAVAGRRLRWPLWVWLVLITAVGIAGALWMDAHDSAAAFYLFPFRVFQFSLGALVGCLPSARIRARLAVVPRDAVLVVGLALVGVAVLGYGASTPFPGWHALPPTIGTALLLVAGSRASGSGPIGRVLLENPVSVWIGRVSYSMYLAHWPIIALYRYDTGVDLSLREQVGLGLATLVGTVALHYGVERRFYARAGVRSGGSPRKTGPRFAVVTVATAAALALVLTSAWRVDGWSWRYPDLALTPAQIEAGMNARFDLVRKGCSVVDLDRKSCHLDRATQVLVIGNSHEPDGYNFLAGGFGRDRTVNLVSFGTVNQCGDLVPRAGRWTSAYGDCQRRLDNLFAHVRMFDDVLYVANQPFAPNKAQLLGVLRSIKEQNPAVRILTLGGYINTAVPCSRLVNETGSARACATPKNVVYFESDPSAYPLSAAVMALTDVYIDRVGFLCPGRVLTHCRVQARGGAPAFYDEHHQSLEFATETGAEYAAAHPDLLAPHPGSR